MIRRPDRPPEMEDPRDRLRSMSYWGGWSLLVVIVALYGFLSLNTSATTRHSVATLGPMPDPPLPAGELTTTTIELDGQTRSITLFYQPVLPAEGDSICVAIGTRRITRQTTFTLASDIACESPSATPDVD